MGTEARAAVPALADALKDKDSEVRCVAADALGRMGADAKAAVPALAEALKDKDGEAAAHAAQRWLSSGRRRRPPYRPWPRPCRTARFVPSRLRPWPALAPCRSWRRALADKEEEVRIEVVLALRTLGKAAVPALTGALKDASAEVRSNTAAVLGKLGADARGATLALASLLKDKNEEVRYRAAAALAAIGPGARAALPKLEAASDDDAERVRRAVRDALNAIRAKE